MWLEPRTILNGSEDRQGHRQKDDCLDLFEARTQLDAVDNCQPQETAVDIIEQHCTPDGLLRFIVVRNDDGDISLGFEGFASHTHADILASLSGLPQDAAVRQYVDDLLGGRSVIGVARIGERIREAWVADAPHEDQYKPDSETIEFRYWDGRAAGLVP
jgi:hypothetical protein